MFTFLQRYFDKLKKKNKLRKFIRISSEFLYSEKYNLSNESECEELITIITNLTSGLDLLCSLISIDISICDNLSPDNNFTYGLNKIENIDIDNPKQFYAYIAKYREEIKNSLLQFDLHLKKGKEAYKHNLYSYNGLVYANEKLKQGRLTRNEQLEYKERSDKIAKLEAQLKEEEEREYVKLEEQQGRERMDAVDEFIKQTLVKLEQKKVNKNIKQQKKTIEELDKEKRQAMNEVNEFIRQSVENEQKKNSDNNEKM